jgi:hypothetical protein
MPATLVFSRLRGSFRSRGFAGEAPSQFEDAARSVGRLDWRARGLSINGLWRTWREVEVFLAGGALAAIAFRTGRIAELTGEAPTLGRRYGTSKLTQFVLGGKRCIGSALSTAFRNCGDNIWSALATGVLAIWWAAASCRETRPRIWSAVACYRLRLAKLASPRVLPCAHPKNHRESLLPYL